jgi:Spy/CpxP family protein refolding chaperone
MKRLMATLMLTLLAASLGWAQGEGPADAPPPPDLSAAQGPTTRERVIIRRDDRGRSFTTARREGFGAGAQMMGMMRGPWEGKWWKNAELAQKLGLTDDQISKMEQIFQDHRLQLIDLHAALEKAEVVLEPMINADHPDEQQTLTQIDKVAQARANLEKSNARMLFAFYRRVPGPGGQLTLPAPPAPPDAPAPAPPANPNSQDQ